MFRQIASDFTILDTFKNILDYNEADEFTQNKTFKIYVAPSIVRPDNIEEVSKPVKLDRILYKVKQNFDAKILKDLCTSAYTTSRNPIVLLGDLKKDVSKNVYDKVFKNAIFYKLNVYTNLILPDRLISDNGMSKEDFTRFGSSMFRFKKSNISDYVRKTKNNIVIVPPKNILGAFYNEKHAPMFTANCVSKNKFNNSYLNSYPNKKQILNQAYSYFKKTDQASNNYRQTHKNETRTNASIYIFESLMEKMIAGMQILENHGMFPRMSVSSLKFATSGLSVADDNSGCDGLSKPKMQNALFLARFNTYMNYGSFLNNAEQCVRSLDNNPQDYEYIFLNTFVYEQTVPCLRKDIVDSTDSSISSNDDTFEASKSAILERSKKYNMVTRNPMMEYITYLTNILSYKELQI